MAALALLALLGGPSDALAQSDNFDSGTLGSQWTAYQFFPQSYTFVPSGSGKALRIQANPVPEAAPAAAAIAQTNVYTNFYVALDVVDWAIKDQAVVLLGQWTLGGSDGLSEGTGMILNYDVAQDGENPGDRKGGQFQINSIAPGFDAATKAAADITLEPGRSYRLVFQGVGTAYTGKVYDLQDLTTPLVTLHVEDATYSTGLCGFLSFSRNGTVGVTDVTIDNYFAGATDSNPAPAPALAHPVEGTPMVVTRTPASRFANFHPVASGISFQARTFTAAQIDAAATKFFLNGADVSASLAPLPANGSTASFTAAAGTLAPNQLYAARIELQDTTGTLRSTNTFWFDTFTDAYVGTAPVRTIEAEDYNYDSGKYQLGGIPVSGLDTNGAQVGGNGVGYYNLLGTPEVDYFKPGGTFNAALAEYRTEDRVQITQGSALIGGRDEAGDIVDAVTSATDPYRINDTQRSQYTAAKVLEYVVRLTSPGDWMNYTRDFAAGNYNVYLRCGSFGSTTAYLDQVTGDSTATNQTTVRLGTFEVGNHLMRLNYRYEPLTSGGAPAVVNLSGTNTLRLTMGGTESKDARLVSLDYLLLIPAAATTSSTVFDDFNDGNDTANPAWDHYDPIGGVTAPPATFTFPDGHYRIIAPAQQAAECDAGPARAGSFVSNGGYENFYVSADLVDFDDTVRQAFGVAARITTPGLGTTGGYLFSWEPGNGVLPGETNGDLDISLLVNEAAVAQIETVPSALHLTKGKSYRFVFAGSGNNFEARVYELPDITNPLIVLPGTDPENTYPAGLVGLIVASNEDCAVGADATWDNFLATTAEPDLAVSLTGSSVTLTWPAIPFVLQSSPSLTTPVWTPITSGISEAGGQKSYSTPADGSAFYRLTYP
ncbi:MAG: hypothetical protein RIS76_3726 [Verrucomicrobiota bacterium]|jgi:hypothetical protein